MPTRAPLRRLAAGIIAAASVSAFAAPAVRDPSPAGATAPRVLVVGDSLAVGTEAFLGPLLRYRDVTWEAKSGRTTPQGLVALRAGLQHVTPQTVVVSLGTNDGPDPGRFGNRIDRLLALVPRGSCIVWATIYRPPRKGPYVALNRVLHEKARQDDRLHLVPWDRVVARGRVDLPDG